MKNIAAYFTDFLSSGNERTRLVKKNISATFLIKGFSILIGLVLIPMTINYVNPVQYGIWITLSSIINWFNFFDIGFGNGLRNKVAEENALNKPENARLYISTTYVVLALISGVLFLLFSVVNHFLNWNVILNVSPAVLNNLSKLTLILFGFFCVQFVLQLINVVLYALHQPARISLINFLGQLLIFIIIYILTLKTTGKLEYLIFAFAGAPLLVQLLASLWFYGTSLKKFSPRFKLVKLKYAKSLFSIGIVFFIIQIGALILYETDNIVIIQLFGPKDVTVFNIAYKLFSAITMLSTIIMTPFWSAFTDAYYKNDFDWIKATNKKLYSYLAFVCLGSFLLFLVSPVVVSWWLGSKIHVPLLLSFVMSLQIMGYCWLMINCFFLNGIGKIKLQFYLYIICIIVNIPVSIFLGKTIGIAGITISNLVIFIYMDIVLYIQCKKIINKTAVGIWDK